MSRMTGEPIIVKPESDVLTALLGVALAAEVVALVVLFLRAKTLFPDGLF